MASVEIFLPVIQGPSPFVHRGGWEVGRYLERDTVTHSGSTWLAQRATSEEPGEDAEDWTALLDGSAAEAARQETATNAGIALGAKGDAITARIRAEAAASGAVEAKSAAETARDLAQQAITDVEEAVLGGVSASGTVITTTANPQKILNENASRKMWRVFNLSGSVTSMLGYSNVAGDAGIPLSIGGMALPGYVADIPVEVNELWHHGPVGTVLSVQEG